jgi:hypothetical protein
VNLGISKKKVGIFPNYALGLLRKEKAEEGVCFLI